MKISLAYILSAMILFSSIQEGISQFSSIMFSTENCCASKTTDNQDDTCDLDDVQDAESCCDGAVCDCTCCIHVSLFSTSFGELSFQGEAEKDIYNYVDTYGHSVPFPIFHPPLSLV